MIPVERLEKVRKRVEEIHTLLTDPKVSTDGEKIQSLGKELARLEPLARLYQDYLRLNRELEDAEHLASGESKDKEMAAFYQEERAALQKKQSDLERELEDKLIGGDEEDDGRNVIVEIRAGTGGEEAALFAKDLFRMYSRYCQEHGFATEIMDTSATGKGGFKEIIFGASGAGIYASLKYESGIHRVQRVPETEASGRIHTSAATVAVLKEVDEVEVDIKPEELRIEVCRASGPGGQGVNTTDSAVQILHIPTGLIVRCQDERSQLKNKAKAMRVLRARLFQLKKEAQAKEISENRRKQVGSGDRSGKIRTYNFPDNRVTDHRIGLTLHSLDDILNGRLGDLVSALRQHERSQRLSQNEDTAS